MANTLTSDTGEMDQKLNRLLVILAHPDDESYGMGGTLAKFADHGVHIDLLCATLGEAGVPGKESGEAGDLRKKELLKAADYLGTEVIFLGLHDGKLSSVNKEVLVTRITDWIDLIRPDLIVTFGPDGVSGHPDHVAISWAVTQAVDLFYPEKNLLYIAPSEATILGCGVSSNPIDSVDQLIAIDIGEYKIKKIQAIQSHASQNSELTDKPEEEVDKIPCYEYFSIARSKKSMSEMTDWLTDLPHMNIRSSKQKDG